MNMISKSPLVTKNSKLTPNKTQTGWHYNCPEGLLGVIDNIKDGIVCRIKLQNHDKSALPPSDVKPLEVVQLGIGAATGSLCNAIFSPSEDTALVMKADGLMITPKPNSDGGNSFEISCQGPLTITVIERYVSVHCGYPWYAPMDKTVFKRPLAGWCSWYYYYLTITEEEVQKNTDWLAANLKQFGCEWVQIDDGWQGRGEGLGDNRDWFTTCEGDFPSGMKAAADYIKSRGLKPGIWCIPFTQSDEALFNKKPELFVRRDDGTSPGAELDRYPDDLVYQWPGLYHIDNTSKEGHEYLEKLIHMLCNQWGYDYLKIDGTSVCSIVHNHYRKNLADPSLDGDRAYRAGLEVIKNTMGPERYLLNCVCGCGWAGFGLSQGMRTGGDVELSWEGLLNGISCTLDALFLNTIAFYTDPDVVCVREPLPFEQAQLWATFIGITGQMLLSSDKMYELPESRVELLRRIYPVADIRPMELYALDPNKMPQVFDLKIDIPHIGKWDVVAVFNWEDEDAEYVITPEILGLASEEWICTDVWGGYLLDNEKGRVNLQVGAKSCRVVGYWPNLGRPQFIGTNRHLTQGSDDVSALSWDGDSLILSGCSQVVGGDPYKIRVYVPSGFAPCSKEVNMVGNLGEMVIVKDSNTAVEWSIKFKRLA